MTKIALQLFGALFAFVALTPSSAHALPITVTTGSSFSLDFNGFYDANQFTIPGLSAKVSLSNFVFTNTALSGKTATQVDLVYSIFNNSAAPVLTSRVSNFAFNTTPNILANAPNVVTGVFDTVAVNANQPNGIGMIEMCFTGQGCPGGGSGGVTAGNTAGGTARIFFDGTVTQFSIDDAVVRYQSVSCSTGATCNTSASGFFSTDGEVPEPGTWVMLGGGLVILSALRIARS